MAQGASDFDTGHPDYDLVIALPPSLLEGVTDLRLGCCAVRRGVMQLTESCLMSMQLKDIGSGNFGVAKLMRYKPTGELVAVKFIERGDKVQPPPLPHTRLTLGSLHGVSALWLNCAGIILGWSWQTHTCYFLLTLLTA